jgi:3-oxoacyl-[acyl-carrier-protein] synthase-3
MNKRYSVRIAGIGSYLPNAVVTNKMLEAWYGADAKWTESHLGIKERRWTGTDELTSDLAHKAALKAIEDSGLTKSEIDLMIVATSSPDRISPSTACIVAEKLGVSCPSFDINAVCTGFLYGLNIATPLIEAGAYKNILLVASETYSKITDKESRECVYFGDGAGAVILSKSNQGWISTKIYSDARGKEAFTVPIGGTFKMNGKAVFETGITNLPLAIEDILQTNSRSVNEVSFLVPHQPGIKMLQVVADRVGLPFEKVVTVMDRYANTAAASIPIALDTLVKSGKLVEGDLVLLASIGSGGTWGEGLISYSSK